MGFPRSYLFRGLCLQTEVQREAFCNADHNIAPNFPPQMLPAVLVINKINKFKSLHLNEAIKMGIKELYVLKNLGDVLCLENCRLSQW